MAELKNIFQLPFGLTKLLEAEIIEINQELLQPINLKIPEKKIISRLITTEESEIIRTPLAPLVLLTKTETPLSFKDSLYQVYEDKLEEIFFQSNIHYGEYNYKNSKQAKEYHLTLDEFLSIYFYTIEWTDPSLNLYDRLNSALCSAERTKSAPQWKFFLYYIFNALRKIPIWRGNSDVYRGVSKNLVREYPEKYKKREYYYLVWIHLHYY